MYIYEYKFIYNETGKACIDVFWNQALFSLVISFDSLWTAISLRAWNFSLSGAVCFSYAVNKMLQGFILSYTFLGFLSYNRNYNKATISVELTMASATSRPMWFTGCRLGSRNISTLESKSEKVELQPNCLASLVSTKCWQVCLAPAFH